MKTKYLGGQNSIKNTFKFFAQIPPPPKKKNKKYNKFEEHEKVIQDFKETIETQRKHRQTHKKLILELKEKIKLLEIDAKNRVNEKKEIEFKNKEIHKLITNLKKEIQFKNNEIHTLITNLGNKLKNIWKAIEHWKIDKKFEHQILEIENKNKMLKFEQQNLEKLYKKIEHEKKKCVEEKCNFSNEKKIEIENLKNENLKNEHDFQNLKIKIENWIQKQDKIKQMGKKLEIKCENSKIENKNKIQNIYKIEQSITEKLNLIEEKNKVNLRLIQKENTKQFAVICEKKENLKIENSDQKENIRKISKEKEKFKIENKQLKQKIQFIAHDLEKELKKMNSKTEENNYFYNLIFTKIEENVKLNLTLQNQNLILKNKIKNLKKKYQNLIPSLQIKLKNVQCSTENMLNKIQNFELTKFNAIFPIDFNPLFNKYENTFLKWNKILEKKIKIYNQNNAKFENTEKIIENKIKNLHKKQCTNINFNLLFKKIDEISIERTKKIIILEKIVTGKIEKCEINKILINEFTQKNIGVCDDLRISTQLENCKENLMILMKQKQNSSKQLKDKMKKFKNHYENESLKIKILIYKHDEFLNKIENKCEYSKYHFEKMCDNINKSLVNLEHKICMNHNLAEIEQKLVLIENKNEENVKHLNVQKENMEKIQKESNIFIQTGLKIRPPGNFKIFRGGDFFLQGKFKVSEVPED